MQIKQALDGIQWVCMIAGLLLVFGAVIRFAGVNISWLPGGSTELAWLSMAATLAGRGGKP